MIDRSIADVVATLRQPDATSREKLAAGVLEAMDDRMRALETVLQKFVPIDCNCRRCLEARCLLVDGKAGH